jgi:hypothetical protein
MHQRRALSPGTGPEWQRVDDCARLFDDVRNQRNQAAHLLTTIGEIVEEDRDIVIGVAACLATSAGAEQHQSLDAVAKYSTQRGTETHDDRIVLWMDSNGLTHLHNLAESGCLRQRQGVASADDSRNRQAVYVSLRKAVAAK